MRAAQGELRVELLREADRTLGSEFANGGFSTWTASCEGGLDPAGCRD